MSNKVYQVITDQIIELLEQGTVPWRKPWTNGPTTRSFHGHQYRGFNLMFLATMAQVHGLSGCWITFNQVKKAGGRVVKGARSFPVILWKWFEETDEDGKPTGKTFPMVRYYRVFSFCQTEGIDEPAWLRKAKETGAEPITPIESAQGVWEAFEDAPELIHGGDRACYSPSFDRIKIPKMEQFESAESYYLTLFHEATHATGHSSRLGRFEDDESAAFGSESYSREELVAEMGAAFLSAEAGLQAAGLLEQSAAYLASWIKVLKAEPKMVVIASAQAQKAADLILGRKFDSKADEKAA